MQKSEVFLTISEKERPESLFPVSFFAEIDGASVINKTSLMKALAKAFRFPEYFGENWDALLDSLRSLPDELEAKVFVLSVKNYKKLLEKFPEDKENFEDVFFEASVFLNDVCHGRLVLVMH